LEIGFGLYARMLTAENLRFARQAGATAIVVHMADYRTDAPRHSTFDRDAKMLDVSKAAGALWSVEELCALRELVESEGLRLAALENFNPALWHDVLLDGPKKAEQLAGACQMIRNMAAAGIPMFGYNFTIAGVWGMARIPCARGGALGEAFPREPGVAEQPLPLGAVWNRVYDPSAPPGILPLSDPEIVWKRHAEFVRAVLPVAESVGLKLAAHPDDPPLPVVRGQGRLMHRQEHFLQMIEEFDSPSFNILLCAGTVAEMPCSDVYSLAERLARAGKLGYVHLRNVRGKVPAYEEVFVDEGDIDMVRLIATLIEGGFEGVVVPDHTPLMTCDSPWHAGMAYCLGYMRGASSAIRHGSSIPQGANL
jgi:mannonate dehydratase